MKSLFTFIIALITLSASALPIPNAPTAKSNKLANLSEQEFNFFLSSMSADYNFDGILALSNCSGALVRFETSLPNDKAMALTNGHCVDYGSDGFIPPNVAVVDQPVSRGFAFLSPNGQTNPFNRAKSTRLIYATMTGTDIGLYELEYTYAEIEKKYNSHALTISSEHPKLSDAIQILSGYWKKGYACAIEKFIYELHEDAYTSTDSIRYTRDCQTIHGTSGSPIVSPTTRKVVGINNTGNDNGEKCTMDNPCEKNENGQIEVEKGRSYGQQTYIIYSCLNKKNELDVKTSGCKLFH